VLFLLFSCWFCCFGQCVISLSFASLFSASLGAGVFGRLSSQHLVVATPDELALGLEDVVFDSLFALLVKWNSVGSLSLAVTSPDSLLDTERRAAGALHLQHDANHTCSRPPWALMYVDTAPAAVVNVGADCDCDLCSVLSWQLVNLNFAPSAVLRCGGGGGGGDMLWCGGVASGLVWCVQCSPVA